MINHRFSSCSWCRSHCYFTHNKIAFFGFFSIPLNFASMISISAKMFEAKQLLLAYNPVSTFMKGNRVFACLNKCRDPQEGDFDSCGKWKTQTTSSGLHTFLLTSGKIEHRTWKIMWSEYRAASGIPSGSFVMMIGEFCHLYPCLDWSVPYPPF